MKTLEDLKKELEELRESNRGSWDTYGSELCAGDMIGQERYLEELIKQIENPTSLSNNEMIDKMWNLMPKSDDFKRLKITSIRIFIEEDSPPQMTIVKNFRRKKYKGFEDIINKLKELQ